MKKLRGQKVSDWILKEAQRIYFHGLPLSDYLKDGAFWRLQCWLMGNLSYELAAVAMILLKWNDTAVLYHGVTGAHSHNRGEHAWVEFRMGVRKYVLDFSSGRDFLYNRGEYFDERGVGADCQALWYCTYDKFWAIPYVNTLWEAMQWKETSYVFRDLTGFGKPDSYGVGFEYWIHRGIGLNYSQDGGHMVPYFGENMHNIISTEIIQDFAKKAKRHQPKTKSIKKARKNYRMANRRNAK